MVRAYGKTAQCIAEAASGGDDIHLIIVHAARIIKVGIQADFLSLKKSGDTLNCSFIRV